MKLLLIATAVIGLFVALPTIVYWIAIVRVAWNDVKNGADQDD